MNLWMMLPYYCLSNFHCLGMCGPLAATTYAHRFELYLLGRVVGFTSLCTLFSALGHVVSASLGEAQGLFSLAIGAALLSFIALPHTLTLFSVPAKAFHLCQKPLLLGLLTPLLPCGQSAFVFGAAALEKNISQGMLHGLTFSLVTTPSLLLAILGLRHLLTQYQPWMQTCNQIMMGCVALLSFLRGFAQLGWIPHLHLSPSWHITLW